jgi:hypothetical protein
MIKELINRIWNSPTAMTWGNMVSSSIKLLILTPLILVRYDVNDIAFWYLLLTINSFTVVIDFGFYPTFSRMVSYAFHGLESIQDFGKANNSIEGKPNWSLMNRIYGTINTTYLSLGLLVVVVILSVTYFSVHKIIDQSNHELTLWIAYGIFTLSVYFQFLSKKFDAVIIGTNHIALINRWNIIINTTNAITAVGIVYFNGNLVWLSAHQLFFSIVLNVRSAMLERQICDGVFRSMKILGFDKEVFQWSWGPTWKSGLLILCSTGVSQASGVIYAQVADPSKLASYLLSLKLVTTVAQFSQAPFYSKLPMLSGLRVKNEIEKLSTISANAMKKALTVFVIGMAALIFFGQYGLKFIGANTNLIDSKILILMAFIWFLERHHAMHAQIYVTTNRVPFYKSAIITGLVNVGLIWLLLPKIDVLAFPIAHGISNLIINNWWNVTLSLQSLKAGYVNFFRRSLTVPLIMLLLISSIKLLTSFLKL